MICVICIMRCSIFLLKILDKQLSYLQTTANTIYSKSTKLLEEKLNGDVTWPPSSWDLTPVDYFLCGRSKLDCALGICFQRYFCCLNIETTFLYFWFSSYLYIYPWFSLLFRSVLHCLYSLGLWYIFSVHNNSLVV